MANNSVLPVVASIAIVTEAVDEAAAAGPLLDAQDVLAIYAQVQADLIGTICDADLCGLDVMMRWDRAAVAVAQMVEWWMAAELLKGSSNANCAA